MITEDATIAVKTYSVEGEILDLKTLLLSKHHTKKHALFLDLWVSYKLFNTKMTIPS